ncbi:hypothetical protein LC612_33050 [Nostoc sp. CHAB 5834]|nr:hypothetical protein [Nostoc sp. CHAB 5834]
MFKSGDVVLGSFATKSGRVLNHYSVVLQSTREGSVLAYTTSLKERNSECLQKFTNEDMRLANWTNPSRWDASQISVVPNSEIRKVGTISRSTLERIHTAYARAIASRTVSCAMLSPEGSVVTA